MKILLNNKRCTLNVRQIIGSGGEADIYKPRNARVFKLFKTPDHPDLAHFPEQHNAVIQRLEEHQTKLIQAPTQLPVNGRFNIVSRCQIKTV